jgi:hypothetical protein
MKKRKSLALKMGHAVALVVLVSCLKRGESVVFDQKSIALKPTVQTSLERSKSNAMALSRADFKLFRKCDSAVVDLLETKGEVVGEILGKPKSIVRSDPPSAEDIEKVRTNGWKYIITVYMFYDAIFIQYDENQNHGNINEIRIDDPAFETTRGVAVGDPVSKLYEKYGINDKDHLYFCNEEIEYPEQYLVTYKAFRFAKYYKLEMKKANSSYYDEDENGRSKFLGMNFFVNKEGIVTHIDYYHETAM